MFRIPLTKPNIDISAALNSVAGVLQSGQLSNGPMVRRLEDWFEQYTRCHAVAVSNATIGLEFALRVMNLPGRIVLVPGYTHPATHLAIERAGMIPRYAMVHPRTLLLDPSQLHPKMWEGVECVMPVSLFGNPINYGNYEHLSYGEIVEDAACSLGSFHSLPSFIRAFVYSFHPRKLITTGEGGMIITPYFDVKKSLEDMRDFRGPHGTNGKMSDIQAAIAFTQLKNLEREIEARRALASRYVSHLGADRCQKITPGTHSNYQSFIYFPSISSNVFIHRMRAAGIEVQIGVFTRDPAHQIQAVALPMYSTMTIQEQDEVIREVEKWDLL